MIKKIYLTIMLLFSVVALHAAIYEYDIYIQDPVFRQKDAYLTIDIPGSMQIGKEGEPLRPHLSLAYALPPGETLESIEYIVNETKSYPLMLPLLPKQADRPLSWGVSNKDLEINESVYNEAEYQVEHLKSDVQWYRGAAILMGTIDPTCYYPAEGKVNVASSVKIRVATKPADKENRLNRSDVDLLAGLVENEEILPLYAYSEDQSKDLLIITTNQFKPAFDTLRTHYLKYGIRSAVSTIEDIQLGDIEGADLQEKIRNTILESYLTEGLDFVLLGGNSAHVPHRGLTCQVLSGGSWVSSDDIPADLYYAALDGDWDRNANGKFGEYGVDTGFDEADLLPELAIGRMPVASLEELENMIAKSMRYQRNPVIGELNKHVFFGEFLYPDPESWASDYMELLIGRHTDNGYDTQGIPSMIEITKWYDHDSTDEWDNSTVINELNEGTSFLHHDGHCNYTSMMKFTTSGINDSDFISVNGIDHAMPIFYSHGCNCGGFDRSDCIASRFVTSPYITVGGVFNSRYGWFNEGQTEGPSIHLHREFENAIYGMGFDHFGWVLSVSKIRTAPWVTAPGQHEQNALRWNYYCQNILGDPVMRIYTDTPSKPAVAYDISGLEASVIRASVSNDSDPCEGAGLAVINANGALIGYGETDATGHIELSLSTEIVPGDSVLCVVSGFDLIPQDTMIVAMESTIGITEDFAILNSYPNPFNPSTTISYNVVENADVIMTIYDIQGKLVKKLVDNWHEAGRYKLKFDGAQLPSGEYICSFQMGDTKFSRKLLLLK